MKRAYCHTSSSLLVYAQLVQLSSKNLTTYCCKKHYLKSKLSELSDSDKWELRARIMMTMMKTACAMLVVFMVMIQRAQGISLPGGWGACPEPPVVEDFDVNSYVGTWYEYERFPVPYEALVKCGQATYNIIDDTTVSVNNTGIREIKIAGRTLSRYRQSASGTATIPDPSVPAKLVVSFGGQILSYFAKGNYWVLATDYTSYALVYSCTSLPFGVAHFDAAWILTRERGVAPEDLGALKDLLRDGGVNPDNFFVVDQADCTVNSDPFHYLRDQGGNM